MGNTKRFIIIDGNSLLFRAYFATSYGDETNIMRTKEGVPTNAIFAFANMLLKILPDIEYNVGIFVGFDKDSNTFRKQEFEQYKANRKPCPPLLIEQFPLSRELLDCLGVIHYEESGIEADDICGSLAKLASKEGYKVDIYTSDKDYLQLIDENISINLIKTGLSNIDVVSLNNMKEKYGFDPLQIIDFKGLRGDSSDNLPGIPGVGDKTAIKFIQEYGSFDNIIAAAKDGSIKGKIAEKIVENEELGRQCYNLATIKIDAKLPFSLENCIYRGYSFGKIKDFTTKYELRQFMARLPYKLRNPNDFDDSQMPEVEKDTTEENINFGPEIGLAIDMDYSIYHDETPLGIAIYTSNKLYYIPKENIGQKIIDTLTNPQIKKYVYDSKALTYVFKTMGIEINGIVFDLMIASYLIDSNLTSSPNPIFAFHGVELKEADSSDLFSEPNQIDRTTTMAFYSYKLSKKCLAELKANDSLKLFNDIEMPLTTILADMEYQGFPLDLKTLDEIGKTLKDRKDAAKARVIEGAGYEFNLDSPKQVLDLFANKRGFTKITSTEADVLQEIGKTDPLALDMLDYRKYAKLVSTYIEGLKTQIKPDEKVHTYFNQTLTTTGRLSSSNPNLQNISTRDEEGKMIKKSFFYKDGSYILSLDYSQIELRMLAVLAECKSYIDVFNNGHDVHSETARRLFNIPDGEEVPSSLRRKAKAINFAIIYGTTPFGLAEQIGCSPKEASQIIRDFYATYPEIAAFLNKTVSQAEKEGYVKTMFERRRYIPEISDGNFVKREAAKRQALNAPVQGSAADLIKIAMIKVDAFLKENNYKTKMVLQIHDELLFCVPEEEKDIVGNKIKEVMEHAIPMPIKLVAEGSIGASWYNAKE